MLYVEFVSADNLNIFVFFPRKQNLTFHANCLQMSNVYWKKINYRQYVVCWKCPECLPSIFSRLHFLNSFLFFFSGNWIWHFMYNVSTRDSLHEMSNSVGWKTKKVSSNILSADIIQRVVKVRRTALSNFLFKNDIFCWIKHMKPDSLSGVYYNDQSYSWPTRLQQSLTN